MLYGHKILLGCLSQTPAGATISIEKGRRVAVMAVQDGLIATAPSLETSEVGFVAPTRAVAELYATRRRQQAIKVAAVVKRVGTPTRRSSTVIATVVTGIRPAADDERHDGPGP